MIRPSFLLLVVAHVCVVVGSALVNTSLYLDPFEIPRQLSAANAFAKSRFWDISPIAYHAGRKRAYSSPQLCIHSPPWNQRVHAGDQTLQYVAHESCDWFVFTLNDHVSGKVLQTFNYPSTLLARTRQQVPLGIPDYTRLTVTPKSWMPFHIASINNVLTIPYGGRSVVSPNLTAFKERQDTLKKIWTDRGLELEPMDIMERLPDEREETAPFVDAWGGAGSHLRHSAFHELITDDGEPVLIPPAVSPLQCSRRSSILFVGASHARFLSSQYCAMLGLEVCKHLVRHEHVFGVRGKRGVVSGLFNEGNNIDINIVEARARRNYFLNRSSTTQTAETPPFYRYTPEELAFAYFVSLLQINSASLSTFVKLLTATADSHVSPLITGQFPTMNTAVKPTDDEYRYASRFFTHIVVSTSPWEMFYADMSPEDHARDVSEGILALHKVFPKAKIIVYAPHYQHRKGRRKTVGALIGRWGLDYCMYPPRISLYRDAVQCGISEASLLAARDEARTSEVPRPDSPLMIGDVASIPVVELVDYWASARDPATYLFSDQTGHHYLDVALEGITMNFLRDYACPPSHIQVGSKLTPTASVLVRVSKYRNSLGERDVIITVSRHSNQTGEEFIHLPLFPLTKRALPEDAEEACQSGGRLLGLNATAPFFPEPLCSCSHNQTRQRYNVECQHIAAHNSLAQFLDYDERRLRERNHHKI